jgi:hypothetical protein
MNPCLAQGQRWRCLSAKRCPRALLPKYRGPAGTRPASASGVLSVSRGRNGEGGIRTLETVSHLHLSPPVEGRRNGRLKPGFDAVILAARPASSSQSSVLTHSKRTARMRAISSRATVTLKTDDVWRSKPAIAPLPIPQPAPLLLRQN